MFLSLIYNIKRNFCAKKKVSLCKNRKKRIFFFEITLQPAPPRCPTPLTYKILTSLHLHLRHYCQIFHPCVVNRPVFFWYDGLVCIARNGRLVCIYEKSKDFSKTMNLFRLCFVCMKECWKRFSCMLYVMAFMLWCYVMYMYNVWCIYLYLFLYCSRQPREVESAYLYVYPEIGLTI